MSVTDADVVEKLRRAGVGRGDLVGLALAPGVGLGMATASGALSWSCGGEGTSVVVGLVEDALRPRWVWWSNETAVPLISAGVRVATCWDIAAVHRLLFGGWRPDPARVWAQLHHPAVEAVPTMAPPDLFSYATDDGDGPVRPDGHLRPEWAGGGWARTPERARRWISSLTFLSLNRAARAKPRSVLGDAVGCAGYDSCPLGLVSQSYPAPVGEEGCPGTVPGRCHRRGGLAERVVLGTVEVVLGGNEVRHDVHLGLEAGRP